MTAQEITRIYELGHELRVGDVMKREVITVTLSTPMSELREILRDNHISGTPVVENGQLIGIISIEDFIRWLINGDPNCLVGEKMTTEVVTTYEDEMLIQAINKLDKFGYGRLPVISRESGELTGLITKGNIIAGLLKKLDIDYRQVEMLNPRSSHIFEDIVADKSALNLEYRVSGENMSQAGSTAGELKTTLQRLGISPKIARRVAIATYEAEMNLIFFANGGHIKAMIEPDTIRIKVEDHGPGIPDIEKAMQPGFSTAPEWVRELGFGAGMGLQNIKSCADKMNLKSTVGKGTLLKIDINLEDKKNESGRDHSKA